MDWQTLLKIPDICNSNGDSCDDIGMSAFVAFMNCCMLSISCRKFKRPVLKSMNNADELAVAHLIGIFSLTFLILIVFVFPTSLKPIIHEHSIPFHFSAHAFRQVIYSCST
ncbi:hypothetical protein AVEN_213490-1 [Araneus ventricosus]|uniref:Uncharacterized protein n=1 Tax=Araneus ventricosus TaxID=182803 RepID=A0A4Y2NMD9_ARAVE|nr:hypothetical protein AVEN_213490-1 [Araneus ventricosus]